MNAMEKGKIPDGTVAIAENADPSRVGETIRRVVELTGGMDWPEPGQKTTT